MTDHPIDLPLDELVSRGIYDPAAPDAEGRLMRIRFAYELGATLDEIADAGEGLTMLVMRLRLGQGAGKYTLAEAAARAGMTLREAARVSLASGFADAGPDVRSLDDGDVELLQLFNDAKAFFGEEQMVQLSRVLGAATARMADAFISAFATNVGAQSASDQDFGQDDINRANEAAIALLPTGLRSIELMLRRHLMLRSRQDIALGEDWEGVDTLDRAVGFCDLVGYTALSGQVAATELSAILSEFESLSTDLITASGGSVVKLIGDEVMFVAPTAETACDVALALVATFDARDELPAVRIGLAAGRVIMREGDYFGPPVNLAARIVKFAPEGGVVAPGTFRELPGCAFEDAGTPSFKGFDEPVPVVIVRAL